jgi:large subunit ribosomal protein L1
VRSTVLLPHGLGKTVRVLVFAEGEDARTAEAAGADIVGDDQLIDRIQKESWLDFDAALAVPSMMKNISKVARILGPRGLMPNPKAGTVVQPDDLPRAVQELKAGRVEFRNDKTGNLHVPAGKASFDEQRLVENAQAILEAVQRNRPSSVKGTFIRRLTVTSTMGPGIRVEIGGGV